jgi:nucleotide-binding universal stress UspA family protein
LLGHTISKDIFRFIDNSALSVSDVDWDRLLSKSGGNEMKQIKSILLYVDAELDPAVLDRVVHIASVAGAKLTLAAVVEPAQSQISLTRGSQDLAKVEQLLIEDRQRELDGAASSIKNPSISIATRVFLGSADDSIIRAVMTGQYDVLTKQPTPSHGLRQRLLGCLDRRLLRGCPCPVAINRVKPGGYSGRTVTALDYSGDDEAKARLNEALLDFVAFGLETEFPEMHIVHAWRLYGESLLAHGRGKIPPERLKDLVEEERAKRQQWLDNLVDEYRNSLDKDRAKRFNPKVELLRGDPTVVIPQRVKELDADLLSIGTVSRTGLSSWLIGNTAEAILDCIDCSVVTLKPEGFVPPVSAT